MRQIFPSALGAEFWDMHVLLDLAMFQVYEITQGTRSLKHRAIVEGIIVDQRYHGC